VLQQPVGILKRWRWQCSSVRRALDDFRSLGSLRRKHRFDVFDAGL
jgi:hypothetical protein